MKDHEIRETVNTVVDIALRFRDSQQLRERIANVLRPALADGIPPKEYCSGCVSLCEECKNRYYKGEKR